MKSLFLAFVALTLAVDAALAIECYQCGYVDGGDFEGLEGLEMEKSCQSGKKPKKDLNKACGPLADSCAKIVAEQGDVKATLRTCWIKATHEVIGIETGTCIEKSGKDLADFLEIIGGPGAGVGVENAKATFCTCTGEKCNSSSMVKVTQGSLMVLVIGFLASKMMY